MTTRAELLDTFAARLTGFLLSAAGRNAAWIVMDDERSAIVESELSLDATRRVERHIIFFWDADVRAKSNAQFYVVDRGTADEAAYWLKNNDPQPDPSPTFHQEMTAWLTSQLDETFGSMTLRHVERMTANNNIERGTADVIMETETGDFVRRSVAVWRDASNNWQTQTIS